MTPLPHRPLNPYSQLFSVLRARKAAELELIRRVVSDPAVGAGAAAGAGITEASFDAEGLGLIFRACLEARRQGLDRWATLCRAAHLLADAGAWDFTTGPRWLVRLFNSFCDYDPAGAFADWTALCVAMAAAELLRLCDGLRDATAHLRRGWAILEQLTAPRRPARVRREAVEC